MTLADMTDTSGPEDPIAPVLALAARFTLLLRYSSPLQSHFSSRLPYKQPFSLYYDVLSFF